MPLSQDDHLAFDELAKAEDLYQRYLEVAKLADLTAIGVEPEVAAPSPTAVGLRIEPAHLGLEVHTQR